MTQIWMQRAFKPVRASTPRWVSNFIRSLGTAVLTPLLFSRRTGHWKSSFAMMALSSRGTAIPWYTYPCIDFLKYRSFENKVVLEFGAGQSTLWWAQKAARVVALEGDEAWLKRLEPELPANAQVHLVPMSSPSACVDAVNRVLANHEDTRFDVVVIDGLWRDEMVDIAVRVVKDDGIVICDNAESFGFHEAFRHRDFLRVDFFGHAPGVVLPHCTSIYFRPASPVVAAAHPIPVVAKES